MMSAAENAFLVEVVLPAFPSPRALPTPAHFLPIPTAPTLPPPSPSTFCDSIAGDARLQSSHRSGSSRHFFMRLPRLAPVQESEESLAFHKWATPYTNHSRTRTSTTMYCIGT